MEKSDDTRICFLRENYSKELEKAIEEHGLTIFEDQMGLLKFGKIPKHKRGPCDLIWLKISSKAVRRKTGMTGRVIKEKIMKLTHEFPKESHCLFRIGARRSSGFKPTVFDKDGFALAFKDEDWCPKTFIFDSSNTITQEFLDYYESHPEVRWIWKPSRGSCGKSITFLTPGASVDRVKREMKRAFTRWESSSGRKVNETSVMQVYLQNPLLHKKKKFDIRVYGLIACYDPPIAFVHPGRGRKCANAYIKNASEGEFGRDVSRFLTNAAVNRTFARDPLDIELSIEDLCELMAAQGSDFKEGFIGDPEADSDSIREEYVRKIKEIFGSITAELLSNNKGPQVFKSQPPGNRLMPFNFFGGDIFLTDDGRIHCFEVNDIPCGKLLDLVPNAVKDMMSILFEAQRMKRENDSFNLEVSGEWYQLDLNCINRGEEPEEEVEADGESSIVALHTDSSADG